ncbi:MAG TPA: hypothetical protein DEB31_06105 [Clostridiales bacterium]|nr:hypothetical protein [Clostridiales bacterium]
MPLPVKVILAALLAGAAASLVLELHKADRVRVIKIEEDFTVRYPRVYLWLCIVFFMLVGMLALDTAVTQSRVVLSIAVACILFAVGVPFFLYAVIWKIDVREKYIRCRSPIGVKRKFEYKDIKKAVVSKNTICLFTASKTYRFPRNTVYREYFLKRLHVNGVVIERFDV